LLVIAALVAAGAILPAFLPTREGVTKGPASAGNTAAEDASKEPASTASTPDEPSPKPRRVPFSFSSALQKAILAAPALTPQYADAERKLPIFRPTGKLELSEQSSRPDGSTVLLVKAAVESRGDPAKPPLPGSVCLRVWVDPQGRVTEARTVGVRDADTAELEKLLDKRR
jgi:hypothetical protein